MGCLERLQSVPGLLGLGIGGWMGYLAGARSPVGRLLSERAIFKMTMHLAVRSLGTLHSGPTP